MIIHIRATRRPDGMIDYERDGPGTYKAKPAVLPPVFEKLEAQLVANKALQREAETFIDELGTRGEATLSFPERLDRFFS